MPTKNPRVMLVLEPPLHKWLKKNAEKSGLSVSGLIRDLVRDAYVESEDAALAKEGEDRIATLDRKKMKSHKEAWG